MVLLSVIETARANNCSAAPTSTSATTPEPSLERKYLMTAGDTPSTAHVHHWILGEPSGLLIDGRCRGCGDTRSFPATPTNPYMRGLAARRPNAKTD